VVIKTKEEGGNGGGEKAKNGTFPCKSLRGVIECSPVTQVRLKGFKGGKKKGGRLAFPTPRRRKRGSFLQGASEREKPCVVHCGDKK